MNLRTACGLLGLASAMLPSTTIAQPRVRVSNEPSVTLGSVGGTGAEMFGRVVGVTRLRSGSLIVADGVNLELKLFSPGGKLLKRSGRAGDGPGEFRTIKSMLRCSGDSVFVYDPGLFRLSVFGPDGAFVRLIDVRKAAGTGAPPYDFFCNTMGVTAYMHRSSDRPAGIGPRRPNVVISVARQGSTAAPLGTFPTSERYFDGSNDFPRPLGKETFVAVAVNAIYVGTADAFEIRGFTLRGRPLRVVRDTAAERRVTRTHVETFVDQYVARASARANKQALRALYSGLKYPETFPAHARMLADPRDRLWVQEYPIPGEDATAWRLFTRDGRALGRVTMPIRFQPMEIGSDYLLGVWRDDLDVEFVRLYKLVQ